jgi:hypothetical protein
MEVAGRLDAGKDKGLEGHLFSSWLVEGRFARGEIPGRALMDYGGAEGKWLEALITLGSNSRATIRVGISLI